jgi:membrane protein DedA with SNARE-associated domain
MFAETSEVAERLLSQYGLIALFVVFVIEGAMLLYFAPSESLVPTAVWLADRGAQGTPWPTITAIITVSVVGATVGQYALFSLAKRGGREYLLEKSWFRISEAKLERFDGWFDRWGPVVVPVSNALLFTRGMLTVPAGFAEMDDREFVVLSALGTLIFETALAAITLGIIGWL